MTWPESLEMPGQSLRSLQDPMLLLPTIRLRYYLLALILLLWPLKWFGGSAAGPPRRDGVASMGRLELSGSQEAAQTCLKEWREATTLSEADFAIELRRAITYDFGFIALYVLGLVIATQAVGACSGRLVAITAWFQRAAIAAGLLDCLENWGLFRVIPEARSPWPLVTAVFSWPKWILAGTILLFLPGAAMSLLFERVRLLWRR